MYGEQVKPEPGNRRLDPDLARIEPVFQLAAVEHQLQRADPETENEKADEIERLTTHVPGISDEYQDAERAQQANRQVDIKSPAPAVIFGQPATERRPHDRANNSPGPEYCHCVTVPLRRIDLQ